MRLSKTLAVTVEAELVSMSPPRLSFIVQNVSDSETVSIYGKKGKHLQGIYLYPHTWLQFFPYDDAAGQWYVYSITGGSASIHVIELFAERGPPGGQVIGAGIIGNGNAGNGRGGQVNGVVR